MTVDVVRMAWPTSTCSKLDGEDLRREPWSVRRETLTSACAMGLERRLAKRRDRPYRSGRPPDWIKVKNPDAPAATRVIEG